MAQVSPSPTVSGCTRQMPCRYAQRLVRSECHKAWIACIHSSAATGLACRQTGEIGGWFTLWTARDSPLALQPVCAYKSNHLIVQYLIQDDKLAMSLQVDLNMAPRYT